MIPCMLLDFKFYGADVFVRFIRSHPEGHVIKNINIATESSVQKGSHLWSPHEKQEAEADLAISEVSVRHA